MPEKSDGAAAEELQLQQQGYRIVGEAFNSYIIVDNGEKILLIDKHAAHERIIFERLRVGLKSTGVSSQTIMPPLEFMLTSEEILALLEYREEIENSGLVFTEKYTVTITAFPDAVEPRRSPISSCWYRPDKNETGSPA